MIVSPANQTGSAMSFHFRFLLIMDSASVKFQVGRFRGLLG